MPPRQIFSQTLYIVLSATHSIDSVHASSDTAHARVSSLSGARVEEHRLLHGEIRVAPSSRAAPPVVRGRAVARAAVVENGDGDGDGGGGDEEEEEDDGEDGEDVEGDENQPAPAAAAAPAPKSKAPKKTASTAAGAAGAAGAAKTSKNPPDESSLPANYQALLSGSGTQLQDMSIVVTGVPPLLGRKNAEKLVASYGGKVVKSLSRNTRYVVVGNEAGPKKLDQIAELGLETLSEEQLVELLEGGGGGASSAGPGPGPGGKKNAAGAKRGAEGGAEKAATKKKTKK